MRTRPRVVVNPRVRLSKACAWYNSPCVMRMLQAAPVLHLASLETDGAGAAALGVLASLSMPQLT